MSRRTGRLLVALLLCAIAAMAAGCSSNSGAKGYLKSDVNFALRQQALLEKDVPNPVLTASAERYLQALYYTQLSDRNKIQYLELVGLNGAPYFETTIKGPVASTNDQLTNPSQLDCEHNPGNRPDGCGTVGLPEPSGVYQGQSDTHFALSTTGALIKWSGMFVVSDQPFHTKIPVQLTADASKPVTPTDTSHVRSGAQTGKKK